MGFPNNFQCAQCAAILRELAAGPQSDLDRLKDNCLAAGRDLADLRNEILASFANNESAESMHAYYPRFTEGQRKKAEHEALTGHSVYTHGLRIALSGPNF